MKSIFLARHAKSSWKESDLEDYERPLNKRGKRDAPFMGALLAQKNILPDLIVSSRAQRAKITAEIYAESLGFPIENILWSEELYLEPLSEIAGFVKDLDDSIESVLLVAHNPGLTSFANFLVHSRIDNIPTCGVLGINFPINEWSSLAEGSGELIFYEYPKKYFR